MTNINIVHNQAPNDLPKGTKVTWMAYHNPGYEYGWVVTKKRWWKKKQQLGAFFTYDVAKAFIWKDLEMYRRFKPRYELKEIELR